jgi:hypothetical protein
MPKPVALVDIDRAGDFAAYKPEEGCRRFTRRGR